MQFSHRYSAEHFHPGTTSPQ